jgi:membrane-bound lytic murein transglycosylase B
MNVSSAAALAVLSVANRLARLGWTSKGRLGPPVACPEESPTLKPAKAPDQMTKPHDFFTPYTRVNPA